MSQMNRKRGHTVYSKTRGSDVAQGVEITEWEKRDDTQAEGRVALRFFTTDNSKDSFRFVAEPPEAFDLYRKIHKVAASQKPCKEQTLPHKSTRQEGGRTIEMITSVTVEKWVNGDRKGYALVGSRTTNGKGNMINVPVSDINRLLYYAELLRFLSCFQSWESYLENGGR